GSCADLGGVSSMPKGSSTACATEARSPSNEGGRAAHSGVGGTSMPDGTGADVGGGGNASGTNSSSSSQPDASCATCSAGLCPPGQLVVPSGEGGGWSITRPK